MELTNKSVQQYEPLVNKLVNQFFSKGIMPWNDLKSMAYEGLVLAMRNYDETKSKMNFTQYAAFSIRNNILNCIDEELRTVKLSNYAQKKAVDAGETLFNSVSIDRNIRNEEDGSIPRETVMGIYEEEKFSCGDVFEYMYTVLESKFNKRDCKMFYMSFGLHGFDETKGKDISKRLGVSEGLISQKVKKILTFIRANKDMCEMLANL